MRNKLRPYFSFTKKERTGIVSLITLCLLLIVLPHFFPEKELDFTYKTLSAGLHVKGEKTDRVTTPGFSSSEKMGELFPFNPNTIDAAGWIRLGVDEKIAHRIINYRNKGGRFYRATDIKKIWGLQTEKAAALIPFVQLPEAAVKTTTTKARIVAIDINTATAEDWKNLPGIGETISGRIIKFRNQSGGFARMEELQNVYGLSDSVFLLLRPYLYLDEKNIPKLDLNRASVYQLVQKAGLPAELAREMVKTRLEEGNFSSWSSLEALPGMNPVFLQAIQKAFRLE